MFVLGLSIGFNFGNALGIWTTRKQLEGRK